MNRPRRRFEDSVVASPDDIPRIPELQIGDRIRLTYGPFASTWEVSDINEAGAVLHYAGDVHFVGFSSRAQAPNGAWLTSDTHESFIGRAHWPSVERVQ